jgi:putative transcriptional regulator
MAVVVHLDRILVEKKMTSRALAAFVGITEQNLSLLKSGKVKGIRFDTLAKICEALECQPGDILAYEYNEQKQD